MITIKHVSIDPDHPIIPLKSFTLATSQADVTLLRNYAIINIKHISAANPPYWQIDLDNASTGSTTYHVTRNSYYYILDYTAYDATFLNDSNQPVFQLADSNVSTEDLDTTPTLLLYDLTNITFDFTA